MLQRIRAGRPQEVEELLGSPKKGAKLKPLLASGVAEKPKGLRPVASRAWDTSVASMPPGFYKNADAALLQQYCDVIADMHDCREHLALGQTTFDPKGNECISPWAKLLNEKLQLFLKLGARLGLDPAARTAIPQQEQNTQKRFGHLLAVHRADDSEPSESFSSLNS